MGDVHRSQDLGSVHSDGGGGSESACEPHRDDGVEWAGVCLGGLVSAVAGLNYVATDGQ